MTGKGKKPQTPPGLGKKGLEKKAKGKALGREKKET